MSEQARRPVWKSPAYTWLLYLVLSSAAATGVYFLLSGVAQNILYNLIGASALAAILPGIRWKALYGGLGRNFAAGRRLAALLRFLRCGRAAPAHARAAGDCARRQDDALQFASGAGRRVGADGATSQNKFS